MVNLELSVQEVNLILAALAKMPLEQSLNTFVKIKTETEKQVKETSATISEQ